MDILREIIKTIVLFSIGILIGYFGILDKFFDKINNWIIKLLNKGKNK